MKEALGSVASGVTREAACQAPHSPGGATAPVPLEGWLGRRCACLSPLEGSSKLRKHKCLGCWAGSLGRGLLPSLTTYICSHTCKINQLIQLKGNYKRSSVPRTFEEPSVCENRDYPEHCCSGSLLGCKALLCTHELACSEIIFTISVCAFWAGGEDNDKSFAYTLKHTCLSLF